MGIAGSLMVISIGWWLAFFAMLPIGVRSQLEDGHVVPGSEPSAPVAPHLLWKGIAALGISLVVWAVLFVVIEYQLVSLGLPAPAK
ncbi:MAG: DUF1467 family protein [Alphaproteobacteria bacterium]|nr:DUF1467 family protein [Alphaproteobacteria bacterium]